MGTINLEDIDALGLVFGRCSAETLEPLVASARFRALLGTTAESILKKLRECDGAFDNEALQGLAAGQVRKAELSLRDGRRLIILSLTIVRGESGDFLLSGADVTELRTLEMSVKSYAGLIEEQERKMKVIALTDHLTQVSNRRALFENFSQYYRNPANQSGAICLLDIDHFKSYNDRYGHDFGDHVLRFFAGRVKTLIGDDCFLGRLGGEEFCVHSYTRTATELSELINGVLLVVANDSIQTPQKAKTQVSFSAGVVQYGVDGTTLDALLVNADKALYLAKVEGRGRVIEFATELFEKRDDTLIPKYRSFER